MPIIEPEGDVEKLERTLQDHYRSTYHPEAWRRVESALDLARASHRGQERDEGGPYLVHPIRAALILALEVGVQGPDVLAAALLHDVLEDTVMTRDVMQLFVGPAVTEMVCVLTKPKDTEARKGYLDGIAAASREVRLIKLADRLDNVRGLHRVKSLERKRRYLAETRDRFLPIARATDERLLAMLNEWCNDFSAHLDAAEASKS